MRLKLWNTSPEAFTRVELITALASATLLGTLGLSVLGSSVVRNDSAICANNLRQVGRAFHMWASDHGGENPWWTSPGDGGCYIRPGTPAPPFLNVPGAGPVPPALRNNAWLQFGYISGELRNPALLVCPTDITRTRAQNFSNNSSGGFFALNFRDRALSYLVGLHAMNLFPSSLLSGDRSLREDGVNSACSANVGVVSWLELDGSPPGWNSELHPNGGNLLLNDGHVEELSNSGLDGFLEPNQDDNGSTHFLKPN